MEKTDSTIMEPVRRCAASGTEEGHDREERDLEGVPAADADAGARPLARAVPNVVGAEDFEHAVAHEAGDVGDVGGGETERGQDEAAQAAPPADWEPPEGASEKTADQQRAGDEGGEGDGEQGCRAWRRGRSRCPCAWRQGSRGRLPRTVERMKGDGAELEGHRQLLADDLADRPVPVFEGDAEVTLEEVAEVAGVLAPEGPVEVVAAEQLLLDEGGRGFFCLSKGPPGWRRARRKVMLTAAKSTRPRPASLFVRRPIIAWLISAPGSRVLDCHAVFAS